MKVKIRLRTQKLAVHFSSRTDEWATPWYLFDVFNRRYQLDLDVCADQTNTKCLKFYSRQDDSLSKPWTGNCWMNPPYGRQIKRWVAKAYIETFIRKNVNLVVCLLPARTDTAWWNDYVVAADEIFFLRGRIKFGGAKNGAPFPSAVAVFKKGGPSKKQKVRFVNISRRP